MKLSSDLLYLRPSVTVGRRAVYTLLLAVVLVYLIFSFSYHGSRFQAIPKTSRNLTNQQEPQKNGKEMSYLSKKWEMDTIVYDEETIFKKIEDETSLPLLFSLRRKKENLKEANSSAECPINFPDIYKLQHNNVFWQEVLINKTSFFLLSAFFDDRVKGYPHIRVLVVTDGLNVDAPFCQVWHQNENYVNISRATVATMFNMVYIAGYYRYVSQIVSCPLTPGVEPGAVSLVEKQCDKPQNVLRVINNKVPEEEVKELGICYRAVHFPYEDKSPQIVEWFEFIKLMGVNKVHLHILQLNPNVKKVFDYYTKQGLLETREITLPGYQPNLMGLRHIYLQDNFDLKYQVWLWEEIPLTDCLYRNMFRYKHIMIQDMDEILMPLPGKNYSTIIANHFRESYAYIALDHFQFYNILNESSDTPSFMYMLSRVYRSASAHNINSIYNPKLAAIGHSHMPLGCINSYGEIVVYCPGAKVDKSQGRWNHYMMGPDKSATCNQTDCAILDTSLLMYKEKLTATTIASLNEIFNL